jgi:hypothetical protein
MASVQTVQGRLPFRDVFEAGRAGHRDVYIERAREVEDPVIRKAMEGMVLAARAAIKAKDDLFAVLWALERHPDYIKTERARKEKGAMATSITFAWWVHNCAHAALHDAELEDVGDWLLVDADPRRAAASLRQFQDTEKRDLARIARRMKARRQA